MLVKVGEDSVIERSIEGRGVEVKRRWPWK